MKVNVIEMPEQERVQLKYITRAEEMFVDYKKNMLGSGFTALFECIFKLDTPNRQKMAKGFPEEVEVCNRWNFERGYAKDLQTRYNLEFNTQVVL